VRERYTDTFATFNAVQRILDAVTGIRIRTVQPEFENDRAHKIGHSLNDPTVPESVIERRAYSATENFVRSQHDRCTQANASFRSRAGLDCRITRTGGAKCCDWCASVSGSFTTSSAPDGIWGRHDNCKCSITYETRRGSFQQLSGTGKGWDTVEELPDIPLHVLDGETTGAGEVHAVSAGQAAELQKSLSVHSLRGSAEIEFGRLDGSKAISSSLADEYRAEYDRFTEMFGALTKLKGIDIAPYADDGIYGRYYEQSMEIVIYGVGGKNGDKFLTQSAQFHKEAGKWSTGSKYHSFRHELGHALQMEHSLTDKHWDKKLSEIENIWRSLTIDLTNPDGSAKIKEMAAKLSRYGFADVSEFISESVAEYFQNPKKARTTSKKVVEIIMRGDEYYAD